MEVARIALASPLSNRDMWCRRICLTPLVLVVFTMGVKTQYGLCQLLDELQGNTIVLTFIHSKYACDGSAMNSFSCHNCHSLCICNFLIHNVFMKNVKSDGKSKINWAQRLQGYATLHRYCGRHQGKCHE